MQGVSKAGGPCGAGKTQTAPLSQALSTHGSFVALVLRKADGSGLKAVGRVLGVEEDVADDGARGIEGVVSGRGVVVDHLRKALVVADVAADPVTGEELKVLAAEAEREAVLGVAGDDVLAAVVGVLGALDLENGGVQNRLGQRDGSRARVDDDRLAVLAKRARVLVPDTIQLQRPEDRVVLNGDPLDLSGDCALVHTTNGQ